MEVTINVQVGVTPALMKLAEAFLNHAPLQVSNPQPQKVVAENAPAPVTEETPTPVAEEVPAPAAEKAEDITNVALRDAMEGVRKKFEFTDPDNPETANADIHKALTRMFKEIARGLGADKPTALEQGHRAEFIEKLSYIKMDNGVPVCLPF